MKHKLTTVGDISSCMLECGANCDCTGFPSSDCKTCKAGFGMDKETLNKDYATACPKNDDGTFKIDAPRYHKECPTLRCKRCSVT